MEDLGLSLTLKDYESLAEDFVDQIGTILEKDMMVDSVLSRFSFKDIAGSKSGEDKKSTPVPPEITQLAKVAKEQDILEDNLKLLLSEANVLTQMVEKLNYEIRVANEKVAKGLEHLSPLEDGFDQNSYSTLKEISGVQDLQGGGRSSLNIQETNRKDLIGDLFPLSYIESSNDVSAGSDGRES